MRLRRVVTPAHALPVLVDGAAQQLGRHRLGRVVEIAELGGDHRDPPGPFPPLAAAAGACSTNP
jgi:hypothetical protein